jgi:hypothetical protein
LLRGRNDLRLAIQRRALSLRSDLNPARTSSEKSFRLLPRREVAAFGVVGKDETAVSFVFSGLGEYQCRSRPREPIVYIASFILAGRA